jgi:hypothetical protein
MEPVFSQSDWESCAVSYILRLRKRENERERAKFKRENEREREKSRFKSRCAKTQGEQGGLNSERGREKKRKRALMEPECRAITASERPSNHLAHS